MRATATAVKLFLDGELVKTHVPTPRGWRTDWADLPGHKSGFFMRIPAWCQAQAGVVGPACATVVGELLTLACLRHKFSQTSFARSFLAITVGGAVIASLSGALGFLAAG